MKKICVLCNDSSRHQEYITLVNCSHVFCTPCLLRALDLKGLFWCPFGDCAADLIHEELQGVLRLWKDRLDENHDEVAQADDDKEVTLPGVVEGERVTHTQVGQQNLNVEKSTCRNDLEIRCSWCREGSHSILALQKCNHSLCRACIRMRVVLTLMRQEESIVPCPFSESGECDGVLEDHEIEKVATREELDRWLNLELSDSDSDSEKKTTIANCMTPDCDGWCDMEEGMTEFQCDLCHQNNYLSSMDIQKDRLVFKTGEILDTPPTELVTITNTPQQVPCGTISICNS